jgi:hypothetical protein
MATLNKNAVKPKSEVQSYRVLSPLKHDNTLYTDGDTVDMDSDSAAELITAGVLQAPKAAPEVDKDAA